MLFLCCGRFLQTCFYELDLFKIFIGSLVIFFYFLVSCLKQVLERQHTIYEWINETHTQTLPSFTLIWKAVASVCHFRKGARVCLPSIYKAFQGALRQETTCLGKGRHWQIFHVFWHTKSAKSSPSPQALLKNVSGETTPMFAWILVPVTKF